MRKSSMVVLTAWQTLVPIIKYSVEERVLKFLEQHMVKRYHENRKVMFQNENNANTVNSLQLYTCECN